MKELKESEFWLDGAKNLLNSEAKDPEKYTVIVAQSVHSIIRANDALTMRLLNKRAVKHDEVSELFLDMIRRQKIPAKFSDLRMAVVVPAIQIKSKVDYKGVYSSKSDAEHWIRSAEKFLSAAKECLNE